MWKPTKNISLLVKPPPKLGLEPLGLEPHLGLEPPPKLGLEPLGLESPLGLEPQGLRTHGIR